MKEKSELNLEKRPGSGRSLCKGMEVWNSMECSCNYRCWCKKDRVQIVTGKCQVNKSQCVIQVLCTLPRSRVIFLQAMGTLNNIACNTRLTPSQGQGPRRILLYLSQYLTQYLGHSWWWIQDFWIGADYFIDHIYYKSQHCSSLHPKYILYSWVELLPAHWGEKKLIFCDNQQQLHEHSSKPVIPGTYVIQCTKYQCQGLAFYLLANTWMRCLF